MSEQTTKQQQKDPEPTQIDRDCAMFVRDALFPLRRDWGRSGIGKSGNHHQIHPALMALDVGLEVLDFPFPLPPLAGIFIFILLLLFFEF